MQLGVWRRLVGARIRAGWQYRTSFWLFLLSQTLVAVPRPRRHRRRSSRRSTPLGGWSAAEVALLYGLSGVAFGIADLLVSRSRTPRATSRRAPSTSSSCGPCRPCSHLSASEFALRRIGRVLQPLVVLVGALAVLDVEWTAGRVAAGARHPRERHRHLRRRCGSSPRRSSFWTVESQEMGNAFTYGGSLATQYPIDVLGDWLRRLFTFVVPARVRRLLPGQRACSASRRRSACPTLGRRLGDPPRRSRWPSALRRHHQSAGLLSELSDVRHHRSTGS